MPEFVKRSEMPASAEEVFRYHDRPGALQRLTPPWEPVEVIKQADNIEPGAEVVLRVGLAGPIKKDWHARHTKYVPYEMFEDVQESGPFAEWVHTHRMEPRSSESSMLEDRIWYRLPFGPLGRIGGAALTRSKLEAMFAYRHEVTKQDLLAHRRFSDQGPMRILVSGSSGLVGSNLVSFLTTGGHEVTRLTRKKSGTREPEVEWDVRNQQLSAAELEGMDAVVHLAGEPIMGRWTEEKKNKIRDSRTKGTTLLCETLASLEQKPKVLICASAIGIYGEGGPTELNEDSPLPPLEALKKSNPGAAFLSDVARDWEAACEPARQAGIRVVNIRIGIVLSPKGGALAKMLPLFKYGMGGKLGNGRQWWSWIALDDLIGTIHYAICDESISGPVNGTAPQPVTNEEFTKTLGKVLHRPTILPVPSFGPKILLGSEEADALLFASTRVLPKRLLDAGYKFRHDRLDGALQHLIGKNG
ncbi:TIGR01777 family oxidoreductase [Stratiformator vulcanicus]|uniref:Epimerase family protein n=1 Tax=Stratiformator vulcanicus TaxID=2527980 RepID=A0A517R1Y7_9PLAN|nr:TIGR01777 family oxidoreductase [Stratiformator vulcanicus]QDT37905.1 Epimerase family protein [Stratiformator vulcanicus]